MTRPFIARLLPAPVNGGLRMLDYWVWCGSVIRGDDGRYHMFASRWPKAFPFWAGYAVASEVVRAVADSPAGPYEFREVVLPARGERFWDGRMTHNPTVQRCGNTYLLYYIGSTYDGPTPMPDELRADKSLARGSWSRIAIGLATAPSPRGPWTRRDQPILAQAPGSWEAGPVTNPAPCVHADGSVLLIYRSSCEGRLALGVAHAESFDGPYERVGRVEPFNATDFTEDPFIWRSGDGYEMLAKDMLGGLTGEKHAGVHALSPDGLNWTLAPQPKAYSRTVDWSDGTRSTLGCLERPQLLIEDGVPTHLFCAAADGPGGFDHAANSWCQSIPLGL
jgi:hypothetical protein